MRMTHPLIASSLALFLAAAAAASDLEGFWVGAIDAGATTIDVEVAFLSDEGGLAGEISFPAQGEFDVALKILDATERTARFTIPNISGAPIFDGSLSDDGESLSGAFTQHGRDYTFELRRGKAPDPLAEIDAATRAELVESIAGHLEAGYIYEDAGREIASGLRAADQAGKFADSKMPAALAQALTVELGSLSNDIHLRADYRGSDSRRRADREPPPSPEHAPGSTGIGGHEIFETNIGYLNMVHFGGGDDAAVALDKVMADLADVRVLIIDLRENLGGGPFMVRYLSTYLFDQPTHLASRVGRGLAEPQERWTFKTTRGERLADTPVLLLTSKKTVSAGESFAFGLRNNDRATLMGERTAGGGHFGETVDLGHGFSLFLPVGKTIDPKTGEGWEAEGLKPDIEIKAEHALEAAIDRLSRSG